MHKIYTNSEYLNENNRKRVFPLLFDMVYRPNSKTLDYFSFTDSLKDATIAIFPVDIISFLQEDKQHHFKTWINEVSNYDIEIWVYAAGDFGVDLEEKNIRTFRFGGFNSKMNAKTQIMPSFINDPYDEILKNEFYVLPKKIKPNIGFVGNANGSIFKFFKEFFLYLLKNLKRVKNKVKEDDHGFYPSSYKRYSLLAHIQKNTKLDCDFIFRKKYRANDKSAGSKIESTLEFFTNIQTNLYVFCLRGNGNFSVRFYEALIMGRIPVLIDTDVRLPFSDKIDWGKHSVLVSEKTFVSDLLKFHYSKSEEELKEIQLENRRLMKEKLNRVDYFIEFSKQIF